MLGIVNTVIADTIIFTFTNILREAFAVTIRKSFWITIKITITIVIIKG